MTSNTQSDKQKICPNGFHSNGHPDCTCGEKTSPAHQVKEEPINEFNRSLIEGALKVGFTRQQLDFLCEHFAFREEDYD